MRATLEPCGSTWVYFEGHFRTLPCLTPTLGALRQFFCAVAHEERSRGDVAPPDGAGLFAQSLLPMPDLGVVATWVVRVVVVDDDGSFTAR